MASTISHYCQKCLAPNPLGQEFCARCGTRLMINPGNDLDQAFAALLNDNSGAVTGLRDVPAGPLGGVMKCGTSTGDGGSMVTCGWADRGSLVLALFPGRTVDEAAGLLRTLRGAIEQVH